MSYVDEVVEQDNVWLADIAGQEFVDMMIEIGDEDAAVVMRDLLDAISQRGPSLPNDARHALAYMQQALAVLA